MRPISIADLNNAKLDVDHISELATSQAATATDRLGNAKPTVRAAVNSLAAFNSRGAFVAGQAYAIKDVYTSGGIAYVALVAHTSAAAVTTDLAAGKVSVHQGATREDLAASGGANLIGYEHAAGVKPVAVQEVMRRNLHDVTLYFVAGEADAQPMFARALAAQMRVWVPAGTYGFNSSLEIPPNRTLYGEGGVNSILSFNVAGDGLTNACPVNTSNAVNITLIDLDVRCTNPANAGGGFAQTCGSYVNLYRMIFRGWKYGTILDQTEHCHIREGQYHMNATGGVWLVNGATRTPGAKTNFTNRISITGTQFNANGIGIIDDGGVSHVFDDNNFNGGSIPLRIAGARVVSINNNEIEYASTCGILLATTRLDGSGAGRSYEVEISKNFMIASQNTPCVTVVSAQNVAIRKNHFESSGVSANAAVTGTANILGLTTGGNDLINFTGGRYDGKALVMAQMVEGTGSGMMLTKTQFYSPDPALSALETYAPSVGGGGSAVSGIDLCGNNNAAAKVTWARLRPSVYSNAAGAEIGGLNIELLANGANTVSYIAIPGAFRPGADNTQSLGLSASRWSQVYAGTGTINTSDEREKTDIAPIDAAALRAWARVDYCQFKFRDAVQAKGDGARWHFGVIAQRVKAAFESEGLDPFAYGVLCHDQWPAEPEVRDEDGNLLRPATPAGDRYGIRYEEALALECAYLRSRIGD